MAYTDIITTNWTAVSNGALNPAVSGAQYDTSGDVANNADLLSDSSSNALYAKFDTSTATPYLLLRAAVNSSFSQKLIINFDVDSGSGLDGKVDFAIVANVASIPNSTGNGVPVADGIYITGSDGTGLNTRPNNTDFFIAAGTASQFLAPDSAIAKTAIGSDNYIDIIINFNELKLLLQDNTTGDGDAQVVLNQITNFDENTPVRFALTSSANLNNVNKDISGTSTNDQSLDWTTYFSDVTSIANLQAQDTVPTITNITSSTANGSYGVGDLVTITVTFDEAVDVTGTPQLTLETGTTDRTIDYVSGTGTNTLTFTYTVQAGDTSADLDYTSVNALTLNGGTIKDGTGNNATLTLPSPGAAGSLGANKAIVIDGVVPATPTTPNLVDASDTGASNTDNVTSNTTPTFDGTAEANSTIEVFIDGKSVGTTTANGSGNWSFTPASAIADGTYDVTATATDAAGNTSPASAALNITIDSTDPSTPTAPDLVDASDTGTSNSDDLTSDDTPTFSGTAEANSTVEVFIDGKSIGITTTNGSGAWSFTPSTAIADGTYDVTATATDDAGNTSPASAALNITVDTSVPALTSATVNGSTLELTYSEALDGSSIPDASAFNVTTGGGANTINVTSVSVTGNKVTLTLASAVQPSDTDIEVDYTKPGAGPTQDTAGNDAANLTNASVTNSSGDTTAPTVTAITSSTADGTYGVGEVITVIVSFDEAVDVTGTPQLTLETGTTDRTINYVGGSGTSTLTFSYTVQAGDTSADLDYTNVNALTLNGGSIQDAAGNDATLTLPSPGASGSLGDSKAIVIDTTAPAAPTTPDLINSSDTGASNSDDLTSDDTPTFAGTAEANSTVEVFIDGNSVGTTTANGSGNWSFTPSTAIADGTYDVTATATDDAGNTSPASAALNITIDTTAPAAPTTPDLINSSDTGASNSDDLTSDDTPTFSGTAEANSTVEIFIDGNSVGTTTANGSGNWSFTPSTAIADGTYDVTATATDDAGNTSPASAALNITIDTTAPAAPTTPDLINSSDTGASNSDDLTSDDTPTFSGTAEANSTVEVFIDGNSVGTTTANGSGNWSFTPSTAIADGTYDVTATATDDAGNTSPASAALNITVDTSVPALTSATVNGSTLELTYSEALDGSSTPDASAFTVTTDGGATTIGVTGISVNGNKVILTLDSAVQPSDTNIEVDYTAATATNPTQDAAGNDAADLNNQSVTNASSDTLAPTVTNITSSTANGTYGVGEVITVTVTFDEAVDVTGTPQLTLETGTTDRTINYVGGSGTDTLTFSYTVQAGDTSADLDYTNVNALTLNGGSIQDAAGNDASLSLANPGTAGSLGDNKAIVIDGVAPTLTNATVNGTALVLTYDEPLDTKSTPEAGAFTVTVDGNPITVSGVAVNGNQVTLTLDSAIQPSDTNIKVDYTAATATKPTQDAAGNDAADFNNQSVTNTSGDTLAPKVTAVSSTTPNGTYTAGDAIAVTVTFDENVNVTGTPELTLETGTTDAVASYVSGNGTPTLTFQYIVSAGEESLDLDYLAASALALKGGTIKDAAGNDAALNLPAPGANGSLGANKDIVIDAINPSAPVVDLDAASDLGISDTDNITSDATPTFTGTAEANSEVTLLIDGNPLGNVTANAQGDWTFTPSTDLKDGQYVITAIATDAAGNESSASDPLDLEIDTTPPAVDINSVKTKENSPELTGEIDDPDAAVTVTIDGVDYIATNNGDGTWTLPKGQIDKLPAGEYDLTVVAVDDAGNKTTLDTSVSPIGKDKPLVIDNTAPEAKVRISATDEELGSIKIRFDEPVENLDPSDLKLEVDGKPIDLSKATLTSDDGIVWKLKGLGDELSKPGTYTLSLTDDNDVTDSVGNPLTEAVSGSWAIADGHICEFADARPPIDFAKPPGYLKAKDMKIKNDLVGTSEDEKIKGETKADGIIGGKGNDLISGGKGNDFVKGGRGNDNIRGNDGDDLLSGRSGADVLKGHAGNDSLLGGRDGDFMDGGKGNDSMSGRGDNDRLLGYEGNDFLQGGGDKDYLDGGKGSDRLKGGGGNDRLLGRGGSDFLSGAGGNDTLKGGNKRDYLLGKNGNDVLNGDTGSDILWGGKGDDLLNGGKGRDVFFYRKLKEGEDKIKGFNAQDDLFDVRKIFAGKAFKGIDLHTTFEPLVQRVQVGSNTEIRIDKDGMGERTKFMTIATLVNTDASTVTCANFIVE